MADREVRVARVAPIRPTTKGAKPEKPPTGDRVRDDPRPPSRIRAQHEREARDHQIMAMSTSGARPAAIRQALAAAGHNISQTQIRRVIAREMRASAAERKELRDIALEQELARLDGLIRRAHAIMDASCGTCSGSGQGVTGAPCSQCRGDGKANHPDTRLRASREIRACTVERAKLLGLEQPQQIEISGKGGGAIHHVLESLNDDELGKALDNFRAGVEAARALST